MEPCMHGNICLQLDRHRKSLLASRLVSSERRTKSQNRSSALVVQEIKWLSRCCMLESDTRRNTLVS